MLRCFVLIFLCSSVISCDLDTGQESLLLLEKSSRINDSLNVFIEKQYDSINQWKELYSQLETEKNKFQSELESLKKNKDDCSTKSLAFVSKGDFISVSGDPHVYGIWYNVEIHEQEYRSLHVSRFEMYTELPNEGEGQSRLASNTRIYNDGDLYIDGEGTRSLEFVEWISPERFAILFNNNYYIVDLYGEGRYKIKKVKG